VDLCGHATLASAHVLYDHLGMQGDMIPFFSPRSGPLNVYRRGELLILDFPADKAEAVAVAPEMKTAFNFEPQEVYKGKTDYMFVFGDEEQILNLSPDLRAIEKLPVRGVIATATGSQVDFVSRFFAPQSGIDEDPVTGSAHTTLIPYWAKRLGKDDLAAIQLSKRRGLLACKNLGERVLISGKAKTYMVGDNFS
jgi:predicted PhzF superfamily epimerase YddE/YHI9